ncbi:MAG TPA: hypothetical protein VGA38_13070, partial [Candidatus Limnocylindria bacterium]
DQPGGLAKGKAQRRILLETLFNIAEERGAIATEQVSRDGRNVTMCWLTEGHPLVRYARQPSAGVVHLFNFVGSTRAKDDKLDWVNSALFSELLSRVEGDALESNIRRAVESALMRPEEHGRKAGYVMDRDHPDARVMLGEFSRLNGEVPAGEPISIREVPAAEDEAAVEGEEDAATPSDAAAAAEAPKKRRRGRRGGRGRHRPPAAAAS